MSTRVKYKIRQGTGDIISAWEDGIFETADNLTIETVIGRLLKIYCEFNEGKVENVTISNYENVKIITISLEPFGEAERTIQIKDIKVIRKW